MSTDFIVLIIIGIVVAVVFYFKKHPPAVVATVPAAAPVDHAGVITAAMTGAAHVATQAVTAVLTGSPTTSPPNSGPVVPPLGPPVDDGTGTIKPSVTFPGGDLAAFHAFVSAALGQYGYNIVFVDTKGVPLDVAGRQIVPSGAANTQLLWSSFDGHSPTVSFDAGIPQAATVTGTPAAQGFNFGWYEATVPCEMTVVASRAGQVIAQASPGSGHGNGNGGMLVVPGGAGDVSIAITASVATQRAVSIKP